MKKVYVIPIVVGALRTITTMLEKYIESLRIEIRIEHNKNNKKIARIIKVLPG